MTSEERREGRYQRRKLKRQESKEARSRAVGTIDEVFSFHNLYEAGKECCRGVRWKQSTQNFEQHIFSTTAKLRQAVLSGKWKPKGFKHFTLCERGKLRQIDAPSIQDRQVVKVLTQRVLRPLYMPTMIYDNGACQPDKGLHWCFDRLRNHLRWHFRRHGREGGVLLLDLKGYYPNARHDNIYERHKRLILDDDLRALADKVIYTTPTGRDGIGIPLGVEASQQEMAAYPSTVDNWIKCQLGVHCMGHYADDYYVIWHDLDELKTMKDKIITKFKETGIPVNEDKCKIIPLSKSFRFCKAKFTLTETGRVVVNVCRDGMKRARRKLRKFRQEYDDNKRSKESIEQYITCQYAYYKKYNDHGRVLRLERLYYALVEKRTTVIKGGY